MGNAKQLIKHIFSFSGLRRVIDPFNKQEVDPKRDVIVIGRISNPTTANRRLLNDEQYLITLDQFAKALGVIPNPINNTNDYVLTAKLQGTELILTRFGTSNLAPLVVDLKSIVGPGTPDTLPVFDTPNSLKDSQISQNAAGDLVTITSETNIVGTTTIPLQVTTNQTEAKIQFVTDSGVGFLGYVEAPFDRFTLDSDLRVDGGVDTEGDLQLGVSSSGATRTISAEGSLVNIDININPKGTGVVNIGNGLDTPVLTVTGLADFTSLNGAGTAIMSLSSTGTAGRLEVENGLNINTSLKLGGDLTENTVIDLSGNDLSISDGGATRYTFNQSGTPAVDTDVATKKFVDDSIPDDLVTGTGTANKVALFIGPNIIDDSIITQQGTTDITVAGNLNVDNNLTVGTINSGTSSDFVKGDGSLDSITYQDISEKGQPNGYAPLDSGAKVAEAYLPDSILGQVSYQGTWEASTNRPTLTNPPAATTKGEYYVASDDGTQFGIDFKTGDWIISNGTSWEKVDNTDAVTSVFGRLGNVVANAADYENFYLTLAGASQVVDSIKTFKDNKLRLEGRSPGFPTYLSNAGTIVQATGSHNTFGFNKNNDIYFSSDNGGNSGVIRFNNTVNQFYDLPDASGTFALTNLDNKFSVDQTIGTTTTNANLTVNGTVTATDLGSSGNIIVGADNNGVLGKITISTGISLASNNISVDMSAFDTDDLSEGSTNLYYTNARARGALSGGTGITYNSSTGAISLTDTGYITGVTAGNGLTGGGTSGTVTLHHEDTSTQASVNNSGRTYIQDITLDTYGHVTKITSATETVTNTTNFNIQANGGTQVNISAGEEINFINGNATTVVVTNQTNPTVKFNHADTSSQGSVNNSGNTVIQDITLDPYGHITKINSTTISVPTPAITSNGSTPSLSSGITGAEIRSLIGAGTSSFSGSYTDLTNKPTIPTPAIPAILSNGSTPSLNSGITAAEIRTLIGAGSSGFSGDYNDLINKPTIPTNNNQLNNGAGYTTNTGTVTSVATGSGIKGGTITTSGTISVDGTVLRTNIPFQTITANITGVVGLKISNPNTGANASPQLQFAYNAGITSIIQYSTNHHAYPGSLRFNNSGGSKFIFAQEAHAPNFVDTSDKRLKSSIVNYTEGIELLKDLDYKQYIKEGKLEVGLIAQDYEYHNKLKFIVSQGPYLGINYRNLQGVFKNSILENNTLINNTITRVETNEQKIARLENEVKELKSRLNS